MKWIWTGFDFECTGHQIYLKDFSRICKIDSFWWFQETDNLLQRRCYFYTRHRRACWNTTGSAKAVALLLILANSASNVKWFSIWRESINRPCEAERRHKTHRAFRWRTLEPGSVAMASSALISAWWCPNAFVHYPSSIPSHFLWPFDEFGLSEFACYESTP